MRVIVFFQRIMEQVFRVRSSVTTSYVDIPIDLEEIEFIGGPFDGLVQPCSKVDKVPRSVWLEFSIATLRFLGGERMHKSSDVRSAALYRLERRRGKPRYLFVEQQILDGGSLSSVFK